MHFARILLLIIAFESACILILLFRRPPIDVRHQFSNAVPPEIANPLYGAVKYDAPDAKFQSLIDDYPARVSFIPPGASNSILSVCAELDRTNYIRILISKGANVDNAISEEQKRQNERAVQLLESVRAKMPPKT